MWKCRSMSDAMNIVFEERSENRELCYGRSIYDNFWYVGTHTQLSNIGVLEINP